MLGRPCRAQKQEALLTAHVAELGESLDRARAASTSSDDGLQAALSELTSARAMLAEAQREVQALQQQARQVQHKHDTDRSAGEHAMLEMKERLRQQRCGAAAVPCLSST